MSRAYDLSNGAIDFPTEFIEGYAYHKSEPGMVEEAEASVTVDGETRTVVDESYPFEFSVPIGPSTDTVEIKPRLMRKTQSGKQ